MSWIGVESADDVGVRPRSRMGGGGGRQDWMLRVRVDGRIVDARLIRVTEREAHAYASRFGAEYTLRPAAEL